ncbi:unnamed protein product, partial [Mesorhabditis belari]|uniref:3-beta hydroxysteroid dehydrogenase/isomerase domain-containing protein n=1 Tax=Mesorhabditis belari TaxID=2138241 RepID=A0AAF3F1M1_9BILA
METVVVTGGCGVLGQNIVKKLCENPLIDEVRVIDKRTTITTKEIHPKLRYIQLDLSVNDGDLDRSLFGVTSVIHAAKADIPLTYQSKEKLAEMWSDNVEATERLVERMIARKIRRLIYIGDAYSALPVDDNLGLSEDIHRGIPSSFLMGEWGESRTRAELLARKAAEKDNQLDAIFLRPTWIHSEKPSSFWMELRRLAENGDLPYTPGERRGLHQFIYADNLAKTIENCVFFLKNDPKKYSNEIVYLMDHTGVQPFMQIVRERVGPSSLSTPITFPIAYLTNSLRHFTYFCGKKHDGQLHFHTWRTLFEKVIGFSEKKARILLEYKPQISSEESFRRSLSMFKQSEQKSREFVDEYEIEINETTKKSSSIRRAQQA